VGDCIVISFAADFYPRSVFIKNNELHKINKNAFVSHYCFSQILPELLPANLLKIQGTSDWKKSISSVFAQNSGEWNE
jgi:hypothetical protein